MVSLLFKKYFNEDMLSKVNKSNAQFGYMYQLIWGEGGQKLAKTYNKLSIIRVLN